VELVEARLVGGDAADEAQRARAGRLLRGGHGDAEDLLLVGGDRERRAGALRRLDADELHAAGGAAALAVLHDLGVHRAAVLTRARRAGRGSARRRGVRGGIGRALHRDELHAADRAVARVILNVG